MTVDFLFFTQIGSIIAFIVAIFVLYKLLVQQKHAVIQNLKEQLQHLKDRLAEGENQSPDLLIERYMQRIEAFEQELERLHGEKQADENRIAELQNSLDQAQRDLAGIEPAIERAHTAVRNFSLGRHARKLLGTLYAGKCQVCGEHEGIIHACHIRSVAAGGSSDVSNILMLCPNHHELFDRGAFAIAEDLSLLGLPGKLRVHSEHHINREGLRFHREQIYKPNQSIQATR